MNTSIDFLCDLWIALYQFSNDENINEKECTALINIMSLVEKALIFKLQDEVPNILKILTVLTDFGDSEFPTVMLPLLKAYEPNLEPPIKKVA
ncbi:MULTISPECIES: hypothetical protein [unclassified Bartonella]|uniref:hypothetical protein n=1 Tax=unclassified Bartonella TaxID=2645622 RepID=UPI0035CFA4E6